MALVDLGPNSPLDPVAAFADLGRVESFFGVRPDVPGRLTATANPDSGLLVGLHLDNWDRLPARRRHESRNRINLCLGPGSRRFLFVDLDVVVLFSGDEIPTTADLRQLLMVAGRHPFSVLLVTVRPGWAYIAPTEMLLHDGCTLGQSEPVGHVSALGSFSPAFDRSCL